VGRFEDGFDSTKCTSDTCWKDTRAGVEIGSLHCELVCCRRMPAVASEMQSQFLATASRSRGIMITKLIL